MLDLTKLRIKERSKHRSCIYCGGLADMESRMRANKGLESTVYWCYNRICQDRFSALSKKQEIIQSTIL